MSDLLWTAQHGMLEASLILENTLESQAYCLLVEWVVAGYLIILLNLVFLICKIKILGII